METNNFSSNGDRHRNLILVMGAKDSLIQNNKDLLKKILNDNKDQEKIGDDMIDLNINDKNDRNQNGINDGGGDNIMDL